MISHIGGVRLTVSQFLEVMSDDNRFYASRKLGKRFQDVTLEELLAHYIANTDEPRMVHIFDVAPVDDTQLPLFV